MKRWLRIWLVLCSVWAVLCLLIATTLVLALRDFELCVSEWGGCSQAEDEPNFGWQTAVAGIGLAFLWGLTPGMLVIAVSLVLAALGTGVVRDFGHASRKTRAVRTRDTSTRSRSRSG